MHIDAFFNLPLYGEGDESDWLDLYEINIASGKLAFGDPAYFPNYKVQLEVPAGRYLTQVKVRDYGTGRRISQLRALSAVRNYMKQYVNNIPVDSGVVGACDHTAFQAAHQVSKDIEGENFSQKFLGQFGGEYGLMTYNRPAAEMAYVRPGWGDGIYEAFAYKRNDDGLTIGGEVVFIEDDPDLFENVEEYQITTIQELRDKADDRLAGDE